MNTKEVAKLIIDAKIDDKLQTEEPTSLVEEISSLEVQKAGNKRRTKIGLVFASKYCHFHQPNRFVIYDRFASYALDNLIGRKSKGYNQFKSGIDKLVSAASLSLTYKEVDQYLWLYGQLLFHMDGKDGSPSSEIKDVMIRGKDLFSKLNPQ